MAHRNTPEEGYQLESAHTNFSVIVTIPILLSSIPVMVLMSPSWGLFFMVGCFTLMSLWFAFQDYQGEEIRYVECDDPDCCGEHH